MTELGATHVCCPRGYHRIWIDSAAASAVSDVQLFGIKKGLRRHHHANDRSLENVLRKWRIYSYMLLFKGGIKTVETDSNYISKYVSMPLATL